MRQILSVSCITGVDSSLQVPRYPLATQLEGHSDCGSKGPPRLTGTLMASTGEPTEKQASGFDDKTTYLPREIKIKIPITNNCILDYTGFWTIDNLPKFLTKKRIRGLLVIAIRPYCHRRVSVKVVELRVERLFYFWPLFLLRPSILSSIGG